MKNNMSSCEQVLLMQFFLHYFIVTRGKTEEVGKITESETQI